MILPALAGRRQGRPFSDDDWLEVRLLEDATPEALFEAAREAGRLPGLRARLWADFARDGHRPLPETVSGALAVLPVRLPPWAQAPCWQALFAPEVLRSVKAWHAALRAIPVEAAHDLLQAYLAQWAESQEEATGRVEPAAPPASLPILEPEAGDVHAALAVAMARLMETGAHLDGIEALLGALPREVPDFTDAGLWLQRRACELMIRRQGMAFLLAHLSALRLELVAYGLLRGDWSVEARRRLREAISDTACHGMEIDKEDVLALVDEAWEG